MIFSFYTLLAILYKYLLKFFFFYIILNPSLKLNLFTLIDQAKLNSTFINYIMKSREAFIKNLKNK